MPNTGPMPAEPARPLSLRRRPPGDRLALVGDIGSTHARFALCENGRDGQRLRDVTTLRCADHDGLVDAILHYLELTHAGRPRTAALAIAGPVVGDRIALTNHPWQWSAAATRDVLGLRRLLVINDFAALALVLPVLDKAELVPIGSGTADDAAPRAIIGPGTGLGVAGLIRTGRRWQPLPGEGGHATLAPVTSREDAVLAELRRRFGRVSWERVLSGPGLANLHAAVAALAGAPGVEPLPPAAIAERGVAGNCPLCHDALKLFCAMLGTAAGDLALTLGARGGVYLGGGILPRLAGFLAQSDFRRRFEEKGRFAAYMAAIPTWVIAASHPGLRGAALALAQPAEAADAP